MKYNWNLEEIKNIVKESINLTEVLIKLDIPRRGNNSTTLRKYLDKYNIDYTHFTGRAKEYRNPRKRPISDYLENKVGISSSSLKNKLIKAGIKENKCEICGIYEWNKQPINCQLHHINGNHLDNRLDNLQILCPNCHSQTENYCGNNNSIKEKVINYCPDCGKPINKNSKRCVMCDRKSKRKVERPSKEQLLNDIKSLPMTAVGRKYGVSDNAVRKWLKF